MTRLAAALALIALAAVPGVASAQGGPPRGGPEGGGPDAGPDGAPDGRGRNSYANPSAVIAAEIAFARLVRLKGQWAAFRETAAPDAVMFAGDGSLVLAQSWLKDRANPSVPLSWQPHQVWSSCDGSLVLTTGAWQKGAANGWYTTAWQRQPKGEYKWVFDHGAPLARPLAAPDMIGATIAECPARRAGPPPATQPRRKPPKPTKAPPIPFDPAARAGRSNDGTLAWQFTAEPGGAHRFVARLTQDGEPREVRNERVEAPAAQSLAPPPAGSSS